MTVIIGLIYGVIFWGFGETATIAQISLSCTPPGFAGTEWEQPGRFSGAAAASSAAGLKLAAILRLVDSFDISGRQKIRGRGDPGATSCGLGSDGKPSEGMDFRVVRQFLKKYSPNSTPERKQRTRKRSE